MFPGLFPASEKSVLNGLKKQSADDYKEIMAIATERKTQLQGES